jgi:long-chain acyl-CoA synthetase
VHDQWRKILNPYLHRDFLITGEGKFSYEELLCKVEQLRSEHGETFSGKLIVLQGDYDLETTARLLFLIESKAIVLPLVQKSTDEEKKILNLVDPDFFWAREIEARSHSQHQENELIKDLKIRKTSGLLLLTSGTSGEPKLVLHDFAKFLGKFRSRNAERILLFLLFDHIGGLNTLFHGIFSGSTMCFSEKRDVASILQVIHEHKLTILPTTPTFLRLLTLSDSSAFAKLVSLKKITYGTEPMHDVVLERLALHLPKVKLLQTYGSTEAGIFKTRSPDPRKLGMEILDENAEVRLIDGVLQVKAEFSMLGYLNAETVIDEEGWLDMKDLASKEGGLIVIHGRRSEAINFGGLKINPREIENEILSHPDVIQAVVTGEANPITGQIVVAKVTVKEEVRDFSDFQKSLRGYLKERLGPQKVPVKISLSHALTLTDRFKTDRSCE